MTPTALQFENEFDQKKHKKHIETFAKKCAVKRGTK